MALVKSLELIRKERQSVHKPTRCGYSVFRDDQGKTDTFNLTRTAQTTGNWRARLVNRYSSMPHSQRSYGR